ncbi:hypothetical protein JYU34_005141 [Plutella xylostella]|uniref:Uncharacterized protein n=1 Tax=Plutella xylostella TaxID=51655 RepID=A0ABQ7QVY5_PLUXY|nr:hypothetical protein JYU34_005141 [Plutella xylostella]
MRGGPVPYWPGAAQLRQAVTGTGEVSSPQALHAWDALLRNTDLPSIHDPLSTSLAVSPGMTRAADLFRLDLTVAYGTPDPLPHPPTYTVPNPIFSAAVAVKVFTRDPGQGVHVIPHGTGSLPNLATHSPRPTGERSAHPRDEDAPDWNYPDDRQRR